MSIVQVSRLQYMQGRKQLGRSGGATTNDLGEYRVFGLAPGRYYLNANYRQNPTVSSPPRRAKRSTSPRITPAPPTPRRPLRLT